MLGILGGGQLGKMLAADAVRPPAPATQQTPKACQSLWHQLDPQELPEAGQVHAACAVPSVSPLQTATTGMPVLCQSRRAPMQSSSMEHHGDSCLPELASMSLMQARMGIKIEVLDPTPDCPASVVAKQTLGSFKEPASIRYM